MTSIDSIACSRRKIICNIQLDSPEACIFLQSVLPQNADFGMFEGHTQRASEMKCLNRKLSSVAQETNIRYIDLYSHFIVPETDKMNSEYTNDGFPL